MRLLIVGTLKGQLTTATKIAMDNGASVTHAEDNEQAMRVLRGGKGADLLVMGAYGHGGLTNFLGLGGATAKVISSCPVPLLLAH